MILRWHTPMRGHRDFFHLSFFACNNWGFSLRVVGYGLTFYMEVFHP